MIEINKNPSPRELRLFGIAFVVFFAALGAVLYWQVNATAGKVAWTSAAVVAPLFAFVPPLRRPIYLGWTYLTFPIGWTLTQVLLGSVFYLVVVPVGFLMRLCGRDPLHRGMTGEDSYWTPRAAAASKSRYFKQF